MWVIICLFIFLLLGGFVFSLIYTMSVSKYLFTIQLVRDSKSKWGRECSDTTNVEQVKMYKEGIEFSKQFKVKDVSIVSEGFKLCGQYIDSNSDKCVIVVPGRTESLLYSYYFAIPYQKLGFNVLVIDNRSHGESDGKYDSIGQQEYKDIRNWISLATNTLHNKSFVLHGICIGAATCLYTITYPKAPKNIIAFISDGMDTTFKENFKNHVIALHHPTFPIVNEVMYYLKKYGGADGVHNGPIFHIDNINIPILFFYSKEDKFVTKEMANKLYDKCSSKDKKIVWFDHGAHSHLRINAENKYDKEIEIFLKEKKVI